MLLSQMYLCFPSLFIQTIVDIYRSKSKAQNLFFPVYIYRVLNFLGLSNFPPLELVHIIASIEVIFLRQRQAQMKSAEPSTWTSKRPRGEASTATPTSSDMPTAKEVHMNPIATMDPSSDDDVVDPTVVSPLSLYAMMKSFMTTQAAHGELIDELLTEVATLRADFAKYRSAFPPPPPSDA